MTDDGPTLDVHTVAALVDTRHPGVPEHLRTYLVSRDGHWLVKFSRAPRRAGDLPATDETAAAGLGYVNACLVHGHTGQIAHLEHADIPLATGYHADSVPWDRVFP